MLNKLLFGVIVAVFIISSMIAFSAQSTMASDPKWREKQQALFEQTGLKPGDFIDKSNWKKIDGLVPPSIVAWVKKGLIDMKISEFKYDINPDDKWINGGRKNEGKFKLDDTKNLIETATGKPPLWVCGTPFPNLDIKNDPDGGAKFMYNNLLCKLRTGNYSYTSLIEWIGPTGYERSVESIGLRYDYWGRTKGPAATNRDKLVYTVIEAVLKPFDVTGTANLSIKKMDGSDDDVYVYIPAIRRVKRMSGANRSEPYMGTDATVDDTNGWSGRVNSMKWRFIEERIGLFCVPDWGAEEPAIMRQLPEKTWKSLPNERAVKFQYEVKDWTKGTKAPWAPTNTVWIPRTFYVIEAIPEDPYYNGGKMIFWLDIGTWWPMHKIYSDKAMEYWKTVILLGVNWKWGENGENRGPFSMWSILFIDERMNHASVSSHFGDRLDVKGYQEFCNVKLVPSIFTPEGLSMWSK